MRNRITMSALAAHVGVSRATVSNAYNRPDQLSEDLRKRILSAAVELGYSGPNPVAAGLSRGRVGCIGVFFEDPVSYAFSDPAELLLFSGIAEVCDELETGILVSPGEGTTAIDRSAIDGCILHIDNTSDSRAAAARARGLRSVTIDGAFVWPNLSVGIDDRAAAYDAASHVLDLGHRRALVITTRLSSGKPNQIHPALDALATPYQVAARRLDGYVTAFRDSDQFTEVFYCQAESNGRQGGFRALSAALESTLPFTAVLCMSDLLAVGACAAARTHGFRIPDDISIVGFDDIEAASSHQPPLTTVHQDHNAKGRIAANLLLRPDYVERERKWIPTELVPRSSTSTPPAH